MMKILLNFILFCTFILADVVIDTQKLKSKLNLSQSKIMVKLLEKKYPELVEKLTRLQLETKHLIGNSNDVVFMFTSGSVPIESIKKFILEGSFLNYHFNTKVVMVFQGLTNRDFESKLFKLRESFEEFDSSEIFLNNFYRVIDPSIFKDLNITKVPVFGYATHRGDSYPSDTQIKYILRGDKPLSKLFELMAEKEEKYEVYYNHIINAQ